MCERIIEVTLRIQMKEVTIHMTMASTPNETKESLKKRAMNLLRACVDNCECCVLGLE